MLVYAEDKSKWAKEGCYALWPDKGIKPCALIRKDIFYILVCGCNVPRNRHYWNRGKRRFKLKERDLITNCIKWYGVRIQDESSRRMVKVKSYNFLALKPEVEEFSKEIDSLTDEDFGVTEEWLSDDKILAIINKQILA